jgi:hypothetical protein
VQRASGACQRHDPTGLKPRIFNDLNKFGRRWLVELPSVIWSLRTTPSRATGFMPFFLVYGAEAILPTDLEYGSPRLQAYSERNNQVSREDSLDQLDEARDVALFHSTKYQQSLRRYHERRIRPGGSRKATWCFGYDKTTEDATSSLPLERTLHHRQGAEAGNIQALQRGGRSLRQCLEYRAAMLLLPLGIQAQA